jgi:hypothetical protein
MQRSSSPWHVPGLRPSLAIWGLTALLAPATARAGSTFTVNSNLDEPNSTLASTVCSSTPSAVCTLRAAVMAANANPGGDTISLPAGTFHLSVSGTDETAQAGDLDITDDVTIAGAGAALTFIDGVNLNPRDRIFDIRPLTTVTITGLTIRNGSTTDRGGAVRVGDPAVIGGDATLHLSSCGILNSHADNSGGGIFNGTSGSVLTIASCSLDGSTSSFGGAIHNAGSLTITSSGLSGNSTSTEGGAIFSSAGTAMISGTAFDMNSSQNGGAIASTGGTMTITGGSINGSSAGQGGGIRNDATLSLTGTTFSDNHGTSGGGMINNGTATLTRVTLSTNTASNGAGIFNGGTLTFVHGTIESNMASDGGGLRQYAGTATVRDSAITGNTAGNGGGIFADGGTLIVTNTTVSGNTVGGSGGGVYNHGIGSVTLANVTVAFNTSTNAVAAGCGVDNDGDGTFRFKDSLIAKNSINTTTPSDCSGAFISGGYNLLGVGCGFALQTGDQTGSLFNPLDPKVGVLADNGGATQTHALLAGSPALDAGDDSAGGCKDELGATFTTDQRGSKRPLNGRCDIGAFELGPSGDVNGDGIVDVQDVFYLINFLFAGGPPPLGRANVNGDSTIGVNDVFYLINFLFAGGPAPM